MLKLFKTNSFCSDILKSSMFIFDKGKYKIFGLSLGSDIAIFSKPE